MNIKIEENIRQLHSNILKKINGSKEVVLIAVTKNVEINIIKQAIEAGVAHIGENRIQEAYKKYDLLKSIYPSLQWHMIGHLQKNKVKLAVKIFDLIQSVDSYELAEEINKRAKEIDKTQNILIQINISKENTKHGFESSSIKDEIIKIAKLSNIRIKGIMTIAPYVDDPEKVRSIFRKLKQISDIINKEKIENVEMKHLSMGMSDDYEVAIEEGANMVRVGRAIFGERQVI